MHFVTTITDHKCLNMLMKSESIRHPSRTAPSTRWTDEITTSFFLPSSTASFEWQSGCYPHA